jgi:hypothetical protein
MSRSGTTIGKCELCGHTADKTGMARHLGECLPVHDVKGKNVPLIRLRFEAAEDSRYWLLLEAKADATLEQLGALLRRVWLECCGHMSAFYVERRIELSKRSKLGAALSSKGLKFRYEYDFGSTTTLTGEVLATRQGSAGRSAVRLLARNDAFTQSCGVCGAAATTVCPFCLDEGGGLFCAVHAKEHPHAEEGVYLPVVNSPRMGVCGYTG